MLRCSQPDYRDGFLAVLGSFAAPLGRSWLLVSAPWVVGRLNTYNTLNQQEQALPPSTHKQGTRMARKEGEQAEIEPPKVLCRSTGQRRSLAGSKACCDLKNGIGTGLLAPQAQQVRPEVLV
jgi:hypothetical protein